MTGRAAGAVALAAVVTLGACGTTYVDTVATGPDVTSTTLPAVDPDAPLVDLLAEIEVLMAGLEARIIDERDHVETLARVDALWDAAEPRIRDADPDDVFNFEQAIELARSGVERRRPADASKGYKILVDVIDGYGPTTDADV